MAQAVTPIPATTISPYRPALPRSLGSLKPDSLPEYPVAANWSSNNSAASNSVMLEPASTNPTPLSTVQFNLAVESTLQNGTQDLMIYYEIRFKSRVGANSAPSRTRA